MLADGARIKPIVAGGGQQGGLRSGTENTSGIAGMVAAVQSYPSDAMERMRGLKRLLLSLLTEALPETTVAGLPVDDPMSAGHILNVAFPPVRAETLLHALEADGICVGTGSALLVQKGAPFAGAYRHASAAAGDGQRHPHEPVSLQHRGGNALYG